MSEKELYCEERATFLVVRKGYTLDEAYKKASDEWNNKYGLKEEAKMTYTPNPINTDNIELPEELLGLTEKIAENVHDVWAEGRIKDGWTYGPTRDDAQKHHPCLVPYNELTDSEKEYDRNTSMETLKLIIKLGYKITKAEK